MTQPSYQEGLFTAARELGGLRGRLEQERGAMQRFDQAVQASEQGIAAAQQGDVSALTNRIAELRRQMASATTLQEKQRIRQEMANLQRLQPGAQKISVSNKARSIVQGEQALQDESLVGPVRSAIEGRLEVLKQDPEAMAEYNKFKMDQWRTDQAQREMQSQQWLADNSAEISKAIDNNDMDAIESIVQGAGEFSEAAQSFVATSLLVVSIPSDSVPLPAGITREPPADEYSVPPSSTCADETVNVDVPKGTVKDTPLPVTVPPSMLLLCPPS